MEKAIRVNLFYPVILATLFGVGFFLYTHYFGAPSRESLDAALAISTDPTAITAPTVILEPVTYTGTTTPPSTPAPEVPVPVPAHDEPVPQKGDTTRPTTPGGLALKTLGDTYVSVGWTPSVDNKGVEGYKIFRDGKEVGSTAKTLYGFVKLNPSTVHVFGVAAYDEAGNTSSIARIAFKTKATYVPPPPPAPAPTPTPALSAPLPPSAPVVVNLCGNGIQDRGEECDDGNTDNNDACIATCKVAFCGDKIVWTERESCDDGNYIDTDACMNSCTINPDPVIPNTGTPTPTPTPAGTPAPSPTPGATPSPTPTPTPTPTPSPTNTNPQTYTLNVTSAGIYSPTSITLTVGDSINIVYTPPRGDEVVTSFTPSTVSSVTVDSERTSRTRTFTTPGTWTFKATGKNGNQGTITVN